MKNKKYSVSMQCTIFASVDVEANNEKEAESLARKSGYRLWELQPYTLEPETLERVSEIE